MEKIDFVIITGLSGAGKTEAIRSFEDLGFFCVDNLPPALIPKFAELCAQSEGKINKIALVSDIRGGRFFDDLEGSLQELETIGFSYEILFLEASDECLVRRFKETRRRHPLAPEGSVLEGITKERRRLEGLRGRATKIIDTTHLGARELRQLITESYSGTAGAEKVSVTIISFGFKHGLPLDADLVFDVRFLPNPHYVASLRPLVGTDAEVRDYVLRWPLTKRFLNRLYDFVDFVLPQFKNEGKLNAVIGIGCTGGRHRSVTLAEVLAGHLREQGYRAVTEHRDIASGV